MSWWKKVSILESLQLLPISPSNYKNTSPRHTDGSDTSGGGGYSGGTYSGCNYSDSGNNGGAGETDYWIFKIN